MILRYMCAYCGIAGFLLGIVITLIYDMPIGDAFFRLLTLSVCGAWMGAIISLLDHLLPRSEERDSA